MKTDIQVRTDILAELDWNSRVDARLIGVAVKDGVATLTGSVPTFMERYAAEDAVRRVAGVCAIANDIVVTLAGGAERSDTEIAEAAITALGFNSELPGGSVTPVVREGWVTLSGSVSNWYEKNAAELGVRYLRGVKGLSNLITIKPKASAQDIKLKIEGAFQRHAIKDAKAIRVLVSEGTVTLEGNVHNWQERDDAQIAAWSGNGVLNVKNQLVISP